MARRKLKRIEIIILVGFIASALTFVGFWWNSKKPNRDFYLPPGYHGWVMVHYGVSDAPALPMQGEVQQLVIPESGILKTSTELQIGWRRDRYFWGRPGDSLRPVPPVVDQDGEQRLYIHQKQFFSRSYMDLAKRLAPGQDTTLADGTEIEKFGTGYLNYRPGQKTLEYFYLSAVPRPFQFNPPSNPRSEALESLDSREIQLEE